ncbi:MAG TPA: pseudouridine synthase [Acholeplasma sp.]|jgi:16S rRNA pseudouridine516 synthase|nr:pseudouridine synthase [Acholeplasma sp.]
MAKLIKYVKEGLNIERKLAKVLIKTGQIEVNNKVILDPAVNLKKEDKISYLGELIDYREYEYLALYKKEGYVSSRNDEKAPSLLNLINDARLKKRLKLVGRLDTDTSGLIFLTDDGDFIHKVTSPKKDIEKVYYVELENKITEEDIEKLKQGVLIRERNTEYLTKPAKCKMLTEKSILLGIAEGRHHQVKKMMRAVGNEVTLLKRESIGPVTLGGLNPGEYRNLTEDEVKYFKNN